jgi:hypothetical protein
LSPPRVVPSWDEAQAIVAAAVESEGGKLDNLPPELRGGAIAGVIKIVEGMQSLGWRIARPLRVA